MDIEVCIESLEEAELAVRMGVKRVELCAALETGGLTPSAGMIAECCKKKIEVHVLIRPRSGDFVYSEAELAVMKRDIEVSAKSGASGVVFGVLDLEHGIDAEANQSLLDCANSVKLESTFHRAIDIAKNPIDIMEKLISLGFTRILTSGQQSVASEGIPLIGQMVKKAAGRIQIMAGSGVSEVNAQQLAETGIDALHFSSRKKKHAKKLGLGYSYEPDPVKVSAIMKSLNK
ncbi:MAG: copper homeostasis protein CutC [Cyclobacteriaceae bacterium]